MAVIAYYGQLITTLGRYRVITGGYYSSEFDVSTAEVVSAVSEYYRFCLLRAIGPHFGDVLELRGIAEFDLGHPKSSDEAANFIAALRASDPSVGNALGEQLEDPMKVS